MREIIQLIEDHYGYTVTTRDLDIDELVFTAELRSTDLSIVLHYLSEVFNLNVTQDDDEITLTPRN